MDNEKKWTGAEDMNPTNGRVPTHWCNVCKKYVFPDECREKHCVPELLERRTDGEIMEDILNLAPQIF